MTKNQEKLLEFISEYKIKNDGQSPTFSEMVSAIKVSGNKSLIGRIKNLTGKGYLRKNNNQSRSIFLTNKALDFLGLDSMEYRIKVPLENPSEVPSYSLSYSEKINHDDGTNLTLDDIQDIVKNAVNSALADFDNTSYNDLNQDRVSFFSVKGATSFISKNKLFLKIMCWLIPFILINQFNFNHFGVNFNAVFASIVELFSILIIIKVSKS